MGPPLVWRIVMVRVLRGMKTEDPILAVPRKKPAFIKLLDYVEVHLVVTQRGQAANPELQIMSCLGLVKCLGNMPASKA